MSSPADKPDESLPAAAEGARPSLEGGIGWINTDRPIHLDKLRGKIILLDLKMPKVGGLDVLRELKGSDRTRGIPIVIMTSSSEDRDVLESYDLGTNAYVVKPVEFFAFTEAVRQLGMFWLLVNKSPQPPLL